ncbi:Hypothetical predicted protein [Mytilus galloprovincialis]|uniref:Uncharacterized protein n=1 Tax=Mytilus galloprovincialis TaxID=29158 RepID=A0A8B6F5W7_MYTGA|nr:Hypothetical predicted protein [Mytilus galloprovincialis]
MHEKFVICIANNAIPCIENDKSSKTCSDEASENHVEDNVSQADRKHMTLDLPTNEKHNNEMGLTANVKVQKSKDRKNIRRLTDTILFDGHIEKNTDTLTPRIKQRQEARVLQHVLTHHETWIVTRDIEDVSKKSKDIEVGSKKSKDCEVDSKKSRDTEVDSKSRNIAVDSKNSRDIEVDSKISTTSKSKPKPPKTLPKPKRHNKSDHPTGANVLSIKHPIGDNEQNNVSSDGDNELKEMHKNEDGTRNKSKQVQKSVEDNKEREETICMQFFSLKKEHEKQIRKETFKSTAAMSENSINERIVELKPFLKLNDDNIIEMSGKKSRRMELSKLIALGLTLWT